MPKRDIFLLRKRRSHAIDMRGRRYGHWSVIREVPSDKPGQRSWVCKCDCGKIYCVPGVNLRNGRSSACRSCRALHRGGGDLSGQIFGKWTVVRSGDRKVIGSKYWLCQCDCGNRQEIEARTLKNGTSQGCRPCRHKRMFRVARVAMWESLKSSAKKRGYIFALDFDTTFFLLEDQEYKCALTGLPIDIALGRKRYTHGGSTASLDRIDNTKGYLPSNVWWVHKDVNRMKWILPLARFIEICHRVAYIHDCTIPKEM